MMRLTMPRLLPFTIAMMMALLLVKSGHLVSAATAESKAAPAKSEPPVAVPPAPIVAEKPAPPAELPVTESERTLLNDLRERRRQLDSREAALGVRETTLAAITTRIDVRMAELSALKSQLEALEAQRAARDDANWRSLVKVYEAMKPRDAATIFNDLDLPVLLAVLDRMKEAKAALVLSAMLPDRARMVTAELAQMRAKANTVATATDAKAGG